MKGGGSNQLLPSSIRYIIALNQKVNPLDIVNKILYNGEVMYVNYEPDPEPLVKAPGPLRIGITVEYAYNIHITPEQYQLWMKVTYKEPLVHLKALSKALKAVQRESNGYMERDELCSDVYCDLCYKYTYEKSPWNR